MHTPDPFNAEFARVDPESFARATARGELEEICAVLDALPGAVAATVAAHLPPARLLALQGLDKARLVKWLDAAGFDAAAGLAGQLPRDRALSLVKAMTDSARRRRLLQFLNYPANTVGALVSEALVRVPHRLSLAELRAELKELDEADARPALVVEQDGKYLGVLDLWRITVHGTDNMAAGAFADGIPALHPELSVSNAVKAEAWRHHAWLPVADHEERVLGVVSRTRVFSSQSQARTTRAGFEQAVTGLGEQYLQVMGVFLGWLLAPRRSP